MVLEKSVKREIIDNFKIHESDTGSPEIQIALLTSRIEYLNKHFVTNKKDHHSRHGLLKLVGRRRKLLNYLKVCNLKKYKETIDKLGLRK